MQRVLITGGAGFIGSHLADELLEKGYEVRVLDCLAPQVHGPERKRPDYLNSDVELIVDDIRNPAAVKKAVSGVDAVVHFVAIVGVGQSMYDLARYTSVNNLGTAVLLEALIERPVEKLLVASSMSIYGEGLYRGPDGKLYSEVARTLDQLKASDWEMRTPDGQPLTPVPTPEWKQPALESLYALSKYGQERMCLMIGRAYGIPSVGMRFFNAYGPNQALSNPYTGVLAIFASRLLNDKPPLIFEDGEQQRDFVSVYDVARACRLALETPEADGQVFNIGSGRQYKVSEVARKIAKVLDKHIEPEIAGKYRVGDIRHCFPDITLARNILKFEPEISLEDGLIDLAAWLDGKIALDKFSEMRDELASRGLMVG
ncbi:MAG: NAD-dependent epimerase/dehydratase family protein [Acidobacteriaceae bacterium]|nr:NAD-dependent epimerase/dehydratase family protein [Acidobacteriaceae bacterium]